MLSTLDAADIINDVRKSGCFGRSSRQLNLFTYLLEKSISGEILDINQYAIAVDVLNRSETFDASSDSIVRVEMHRLRANLKAYSAGDFTYNLSIPPTKFEVVVSVKKPNFLSGLKARPLTLALVGLLAVTTFAVGHLSSKSRLETPSSSGLVSCSQSLPNVFVSHKNGSGEANAYVEKILKATISQQTGFSLLDAGGACTQPAAPRFDIQYAVMEKDDEFNLAISAVSNDDKDIVDSRHISGERSDVNESSDLYYEIVAAANVMTMPDSSMARAALSRDWSSQVKRDGYSCIVSMYDSFSGENATRNDDVIACLEKSIESSEAPLDNFGALASQYLYQARNELTPSPAEALSSALEILDRHGEKWIDSIELTTARMYYEWQREDFNGERMNLVLFSAESRYHSTPQVLLLASTLRGYALGDWEEAKAISNHVMRTYSLRDQSMYSVSAGYAFMNYGEEQTIEDCFSFYSENTAYVNILLNACARMAGNKYWLNVTEENLNRLNYETLSDRLAVFDKVKYNKKFKDKLAKMLSKPVPA